MTCMSSEFAALAGSVREKVEGVWQRVEREPLDGEHWRLDGRCRVCMPVIGGNCISYPGERQSWERGVQLSDWESDPLYSCTGRLTDAIRGELEKEVLYSSVCYMADKSMRKKQTTTAGATCLMVYIDGAAIIFST